MNYSLPLLDDPELREISLKALARFDEPRAKAAVEAANQESQWKKEAQKRSFEAKERELATPANTMSDEDMLDTLTQLCEAYKKSDRRIITSLEPLAISIGHALVLADQQKRIKILRSVLL